MEKNSIIKFKDTLRRWSKKLQKLLNTNFDRAFGLDISDKSIGIAELSKMFHFSIENYGRSELPDGVIKDGRILDEKVLAEQIKIVLRNVKPRHVSTNKVILSLPSSQLFIHHFVINTILTGANLRTLVQKEIIKVLPINPSSMYWDIRSKPITFGVGGTSSVIFIGIQKDVAESYIRVCNAVGLDVVSFGLEPMSIARLFVDAGDKITATIDMGNSTTNVGIIKGNDELELSITIPIGGHSMTQMIAQGLNVDETVAEAKKISTGSSTSDELFFLVEPVVKNIANEIKRTITYYETIFNNSVDSIVFIGGASVMSGIKEKISEIVGKPILVFPHSNNIDNLSLLKTEKGDNKSAFMLYASVIGLSMLGASNEFENINLLKQIPSMQINKIKRRDLLNSGYMSKSTAFRIMLNSRLMLFVAIILCLGSFLTFSFLWFNLNKVVPSPIRQYKTPAVKVNPLSPNFSQQLQSLNSSILGSSTMSTSTMSTYESTPWSLPKSGAPNMPNMPKSPAPTIPKPK